MSVHFAPGSMSIVLIGDNEHPDQRQVIVQLDIDDTSIGISPSSAIQVGKMLVQHGHRALTSQAALAVVRKRFPEWVESDPEWAADFLSDMEQVMRVIADDEKGGDLA